MFRRKFNVSSILVGLLPLLLAVIVLFVFSPAEGVSAGQCSTSNVHAYDRGGGTPWNRNYVLDVYETSNAQGFFLYYDPLRSAWRSIRFSPWYGIDNGVRFGLSTWWAHSHPWWSATSWRYVYSC